MRQNTTQTSIVDTAKYGTCQSNNMTLSRGVSKIVGTRAWFFSSSKILMRNYYTWYVKNKGECKRKKCHRGVTATLLKKVELTLKRKV